MSHRSNRIALFVLAAVCAAGLIACQAGPSSDKPAAPAGAPRTVTAEEAQAWAQKTLGTLSLERKAAQMICAEIRGEFISLDDPRYQGWLGLVRDHGDRRPSSSTAALRTTPPRSSTAFKRPRPCPSSCPPISKGGRVSS